MEDDIDLGNWICTLCKTLKKLNLYNIQGLNTLTFLSTSLEDLSLRSCFREVECVTISAAKLHTLLIYTCPLERIVTINIGDESVRTFTFEAPPDFKFSKSFMEIDTASINRVYSYRLDRNLLLGTLHAISHCRVLNLDIFVLRELDLDEQQVFFGIVQELVIKVEGTSKKYWDNLLVPTISKFSRGLPNLTTLSIKRKYSVELSRKILELDYSIDPKSIKENEESQNIFFRHLKVVEIETFDQGNEHSAFTGYLMKHATGLEKITVVEVKSLR